MGLRYAFPKLQGVHLLPVGSSKLLIVKQKLLLNRLLCSCQVFPSYIRYCLRQTYCSTGSRRMLCQLVESSEDLTATFGSPSTVILQPFYCFVVTLLTNSLQCRELLFHLIIHTDTPHSLGLPRTRNRPATGTATWQHTILTSDEHTCPSRDANKLQRASGHGFKL